MRIEVVSPSPGVKLIPPCINPDPKSPTPLEDVILSYGGPGQVLSMLPLPDAPDTLLLVFEEQKEVVAFGFAPLIELIGHYGGYKPLKEGMRNYSDMDRTMPDYDWFERRNRAVGIKWSQAAGCHEIPPAAIIPLTLSYAFSSNGQVRFCHSFDKDGNRENSRIKIIFSYLGSDKAAGWEEEHLIPAARLSAYIKQSRKAGLSERIELRKESTLAC